MATTLTHTSTRGAGMTSEEKFVIFASSLGTIFEWYDFYLYAVLAPFFAALFFPSGNDTAALLSAFRARVPSRVQPTHFSGLSCAMVPIGAGGATRGRPQDSHRRRAQMTTTHPRR
jgi:hypothetical protein